VRINKVGRKFESPIDVCRCTIWHLPPTTASNLCTLSLSPLLLSLRKVVLRQETGLAPGPEADTYSGHAEAYEILAALTFLAFYVKCYDHLIATQTIPCYCNNSGVITNLMSMRNITIWQPNDTTNDDYNIYATITAMAATCSPL